MADFVAYYRVSTDQQGMSGLGLVLESLLAQVFQVVGSSYPLGRPSIVLVRSGVASIANGPTRVAAHRPDASRLVAG
jgi:hypothetical protein